MVPLVAIWRNDTVEIIPNDMGERTTPSYVAFTDTELLIGSQAKYQRSRNAQNTIFNIMKLIGRQFDDFYTQLYIKKLPFKVVKESRNKIAIEVEYKEKQRTFYVEEILAMLLSYLQRTAESYIGSKLNNVVISVPVYFNHTQRSCIRFAARIAGLNLLRMISTPASVAIAYCVENKKISNMDDERIQLIIDIGSGTVDIAIVATDDGVIEVLGVVGNITVGGDIFDDLLVNYFVKEFKMKYKLDCTKSHRAMVRLQIHCEKLKHTLSMASRANIDIDSFYDGIDFETSIKTDVFNGLCMQYFEHCMKLIEKVFSGPTD
eukprot:514815_1